MPNGGTRVQGNVEVKRDFVGRDQVIQNILVVGRFLDFAEIEGLISKPSEVLDFESVAEAFEAAFHDRLESDLVEATAAAGEIMGWALAAWKPRERFAAIPMREVLREIAFPIVRKLKELGYWQSFSETISCPRALDRFFEYDRIANVQVVWLDSLHMLWKKYFKEDKLYGIASEMTDQHGSVDNEQVGHIILVKCEGKIEATYNPYYREAGYDFEKIGTEGFRIFMVGLVIDLIRMASTALGYTSFWNRLIELFPSAKK